MLGNAVNEFRDAFNDAVLIYDAIVAGNDVGADAITSATSRLSNAYQSFCDALYIELEPVTNWGVLDQYYEAIKRSINNGRMFTDEFREAEKAPLIIHALGIWNALHNACWWYTFDTRSWLYNFRANYKSRALPGVTPNPAIINGPAGNFQPAIQATRPPQPTPAPIAQPDSEKKAKRRHDRPLEDFLLVEDKQALIGRIGPLLTNAKPKRIACVIRALKELSYLALGNNECAEFCRALIRKYNLPEFHPTNVNKYVTGEYSDTDSIKQETSDMAKLLR